MKIIKPSAVIRTAIDGVKALRDIEAIGRISHRSEDAMTSSSYLRFLKAVVMDHGDWSIVEHVNVSVEALVDRGVTHEIVRHRIGSYTQESTRFVNYLKKMPPSFIYPEPAVSCECCLSGNEPGKLPGADHWTHSMHNGYFRCKYDCNWLDAIDSAETAYRALVSKGWSPQLARSVFPNALASKIMITYNLRSWRHFFLMRTSKEAHPQMREIAIPLLIAFQERFPILFDDIMANQRQADNLKLGR